MTLEEHLACPKCGYDLHGIPEVRCPECGFGYDGEALRSMAVSAEWTRLAAAEAVIVRAAIAGALAVPAACNAVGLHAGTQLFVMGVAYLAAYLTWAIFTDAYRGLGSIPILSALFFAIPVATYPLLAVFGDVFLAASITMLGLAWLPRIRNWSTLSEHCSVRSAGLRRSAIRHSDGATFTLIAATLIVFLASIG